MIKGYIKLTATQQAVFETVNKKHMSAVENNDSWIVTEVIPISAHTVKVKFKGKKFLIYKAGGTWY